MWILFLYSVRPAIQHSCGNLICKGEHIVLLDSCLFLGNNFMSASRWMISLEGKVFYEPEQMHDFASTLAVFFASYYVFNLEYQESASITLEMIQR